MCYFEYASSRVLPIGLFVTLFNRFPLFILLFANLVLAAPKTISFADDIAVLGKHFQPIVLSQGQAKIVLLAELQGRVMTSTAKGEQGSSLGWFNRKLIANNSVSNNSALGGEDRLWFGPETGQYALFFKPGKARTVENIHVPAAFSTQPFLLTAQTQQQATFKQALTLQNHHGFIFEFDVERTISLFDNTSIEQNLGIELENVDAVGFKAETMICNTSTKTWATETGLISIWDLGAFPPGKQNTVVIPLKKPLSEVISYFSPTLNSHTQIEPTHVYYRADANYMNKIGIPPENAKPIIGAYDAARNLLTIVTFNFEDKPENIYVNSVWYPENYQAYQGDVINIFNDGKSGDEGPFGPFYEIESSSNAKTLKPNEKQYHFQSTYHFVGERDLLNNIAVKLLNTSLGKINKVFE